MHGSELSLPRGQALEAGLPPELRGRFIAARDAVGDGRRAITAPTFPSAPPSGCSRISMRKMELGYREPRCDASESLARRKRIPNRPVDRNIEAMDAVRDMLKLDPAQQRACLAQAVEDMNWSLAHAGRAAHAWAVGDIRTVKANYSESRLFNCVMAAVRRHRRHRKAQHRRVCRGDRRAR